MSCRFLAVDLLLSHAFLICGLDICTALREIREAEGQHVFTVFYVKAVRHHSTNGHFRRLLKERGR